MVLSRRQEFHGYGVWRRRLRGFSVDFALSRRVQAILRGRGEQRGSAGELRARAYTSWRAAQASGTSSENHL